MKIGVLDSGLGGLSLVKEIFSREVNVEIEYYGDLKNAPYGTKSSSEVLELVSSGVAYLLDQNCAAIVLACNTATSVAVENIRNTFGEKHKIPVFGMEPAIKPALELMPQDKICVLATPLTLNETKYKNLVSTLDTAGRVQSIPMPGLSSAVDAFDFPAAFGVLQKNLSHLDSSLNYIFVLGCTHYSFLKKELLSLFPKSRIVDGNFGTCNHVLNTISKLNFTEASESRFHANLVGGSSQDYENADRLLKGEFHE